MEYLGAIVSQQGPGLDQARWRAMIATHPNLATPPSRSAPNPFKPGEMMVVHSAPDAACVTVNGVEVGMMDWGADGSPLVNVFGDAAAVIPIALELATLLDGRFARDEA